MKVFRLVDNQHDPVEVGRLLSRRSDHSNQKLGNGMYFAASASDARRFAALGKHKYTHLLTLEIPYDQSDFFDLRAEPNAIDHWLQKEHDNRGINSTASTQMKVNERSVAFCRAMGAKGLIWASSGRDKGDEIVLLDEHCSVGFTIVECESLI